MRCYTQEECETWLRDRKREKPDKVTGASLQRIGPGRNELRFLTHWIASSLSYRDATLLWITEWGIWPSCENWHLFYRLRHSYGEGRLLHEAPGHLFLNYENEDLATFLQVAIFNGWGGYVLNQADYVNVFFSHDEYIDFISADDQNLAPVREMLKR
jgi:hypothetical protein